ncbi:MAG: hypothetical protein QFX36_04065 [Archaeoglobales archaeon]|nr:hypothetical protein [Archaeoglobales archaeon]
MKCFCGEEFDTLVGFKLHFKKMHDNKRCPICGKEVKDLLIHLNKKSDKRHNELWALLTRSKSDVSDKERAFLQESRDKFF